MRTELLCVMRLHLPLIRHHTFSYRVQCNRFTRNPSRLKKKALSHIAFLGSVNCDDIQESAFERHLFPRDANYVVAPLHAILTDRIAFLNVIGEKLCSRPKLP